MAVSWLVLFLQVLVGTLTSFVVGMFWYSSFCLGPLWWSLTFPKKKYGEFAGQNSKTLHLLSTGSYALQSIVIAFMINNHMLHPLPLEALSLPLLLAMLISVLVASTSFPHYIYSDKPVILFLICTGHDVFQITLSTVAICSLAMLFKCDPVPKL